MHITSYLKMLRVISSQVSLTDTAIASYITINETQRSSGFEEQQINAAISAITAVARQYVFQRLLSSQAQVWITLKGNSLDQILEKNGLDLNDVITGVFDRKVVKYLERTDTQLITG